MIIKILFKYKLFCINFKQFKNQFFEKNKFLIFKNISYIILVKSNLLNYN